MGCAGQHLIFKFGQHLLLSVTIPQAMDRISSTKLQCWSFHDDMTWLGEEVSGLGLIKLNEIYLSQNQFLGSDRTGWGTQAQA